MTASVVVAHDYAVSVAQELLARRAEGRLAVDIEALHLLNGGLYPDVHRPQPIQLALLDPEQGPQISAASTEELFVTGLAPTFADGYDDVRRRAWRSGGRSSRGDGQLISYRLIRYIADREEQRGALGRARSRPRTCPWPSSGGCSTRCPGAHMAEPDPRARARTHASPPLADVSHWPQLEAPDRVAEALLAGAPRR